MVGIRTSNRWRRIRPGWLLARMLGKLARGINDLTPLTNAHHNPDGTWAGTAAPRFAVDHLQFDGWVRIRAKITSSVASRASIYFSDGEFSTDDSQPPSCSLIAGGGSPGLPQIAPGRPGLPPPAITEDKPGQTISPQFNYPYQDQIHRFDLAPVTASADIERMILLQFPASSLIFEPITIDGQYRLESFSIEPMSTIWFHTQALLRSLKMRITGSGSHRPSLLLGLTLICQGQWSRFHRQLIANFESLTTGTQYDLWRRKHEITDDSRQKMCAAIAGWHNPPTISIVLPVYNVGEVYLRKCLDSVLKQIYPNWELCIADDGSSKPHIRRVLREYAEKDHRIKVLHQPCNGGISIASNAAMQLVTGEFTALLDHDDELAEHALFKVVAALVENPSLDMIYSDEDKLSPRGKHMDPFFKPDWSPEYFLACMYTCHLGVYRSELLRRIGGWRSEFDGAQDYDLVLRVVENTDKILHIPDVLYHWRVIPGSTASGSSAKPQAWGRARRAIEEHLARQHRPGRVDPGPSHGFHRVRYTIQGNPLVSIIIPTACKMRKVRGRSSWFLLDCIASIRRRTTYPNIEIIVLDNDDMPAELLEKLQPFNIRLIPFTEPFNLARKMNTGAFAAAGEHLLMLNDDIEVISRDWIESMLEYSQLPEIGAVGAKLLFPDGTQQHNGVTVLEGNPGHPFYQFPGEHDGYYLSSKVHRNWSAVTGACMMTRAEVFKSVDGFSEKFPVNYNDVDYCLKVLKTGRRIVHMPYAKLYHHESVSVKRTGQHELDAFHARWLRELPRDPYYNPNLTTQACDFRIG